MDDKKQLIDDEPGATNISTELRALAFLEENQNAYFGVLMTQLAENLAWTMTSINLQKTILAGIGFGSPEEIEAHVKRTYGIWHSAFLDDAEKMLDELGRYEGLDEQNQENP